MRKAFQNMLKLPKIGKNVLKRNSVIPNSYNNLRRLGSSEVLAENPSVLCTVPVRSRSQARLNIDSRTEIRPADEVGRLISIDIDGRMMAFPSICHSLPPEIINIPCGGILSYTGEGGYVR